MRRGERERAFNPLPALHALRSLASLTCLMGVRVALPACVRLQRRPERRRHRDPRPAPWQDSSLRRAGRDGGRAAGRGAECGDGGAAPYREPSGGAGRSDQGGPRGQALFQLRCDRPNRQTPPPPPPPRNSQTHQPSPQPQPQPQCPHIACMLTVLSGVVRGVHAH
eukprot:COSAG05_NODE_2935_length_2488_cov_1.847635_3_plen_166_part_00